MCKKAHRPLVIAWIAGAVATAAACDKAQLLAPTRSTITVSASAGVLPSGGNTTVTAYVIEEAGTPVQNGTTVRFTATLGRVDPVEVQTRNGLALTTFLAENSSGVARITATSGGATGGSEGGNVVEITVGAAAVNTVTLRANPASVGPSGGTVELIATVVGESGQALPGVGVTFTADQGTLGATHVTTGAGGEARTSFTTTEQAIVSASAGTKTSGNVTVSVRSAPVLTISCTPASGAGNCAAVQADAASNAATVVFTVTRPAGSSTLRSASIDFGDGSSQNLGNLAGGTVTITHAYSGPSASTARSYAATVQATDVNGESASVSTTVVVTPRPTLSVSLSITTKEAATSGGQRFTFTATVTGGGEGGAGNTAIESYVWDFGDGHAASTSGNTTAHVYDTGPAPQRFTVTVTARTTDGRSATSQTEILVDGFP